MQYRALGSSGLRVSALVLGSDNFTNPTPAAESERIIATAIERQARLISLDGAFAAYLELAGRLIDG